MKYVIEKLQYDLLRETEARQDAIEYLDGVGITPMLGSGEQTRLAFIESKRLAQERIPQLTNAINLLKTQWDEFTNAPREKDSGERPAFKSNVI